MRSYPMRWIQIYFHFIVEAPSCHEIEMKINFVWSQHAIITQPLLYAHYTQNIPTDKHPCKHVCIYLYTTDGKSFPQNFFTGKHNSSSNGKMFEEDLNPNIYDFSQVYKLKNLFISWFFTFLVSCSLPRVCVASFFYFTNKKVSL